MAYNKNTRYELSVFHAKKTNNSINKRLDIYGVLANYSKQVSRINAIGAGSDFIVNTYLKDRISRYPELSGDHKRVNMLVMHEFCMGNVLFSQSVGIYIYAPNNSEDAVYQRYGLVYRFNNGITAGVNLKAHRHYGDFIDLRLGYSLMHKK